ncbi:hypothetical protein [Stenotrophomonas maltophilia]|jgi:hypothetical protein|nr:hypothetical protein [Stenotrophomonas maltophilia]MDH7620807.1 hypothetical protein [Stenotrophomonas maltophilia]HDS1368887.1 hypothetical protein [Stenotrophomonas maltophilia]HDS1373530.1 hypothetical protein [Stenotrophomonas maltophilia]HDS1378512.1 hypothetical protein [Stenotrophomonas maltophilia]HDS1383023.1 hypothetical protein [Stenotrophomonas maltophilia]
MVTVIAIVVALLLLGFVLALLVWALSALCRLLAVFAPDPSDTTPP